MSISNIVTGILLAFYVFLTIHYFEKYKDILKRYQLMQSDYINMINKVREANHENERLQRELDFSRSEQKIHIINSPNVHPDTLDAIRYAVIKSHPDNGGNKEDFIRFNECYKAMKNQ